MKKGLYLWAVILLASSALAAQLAWGAPTGEGKGKLPSNLIVLHRGATSGQGPIMIAIVELTGKYTPMKATSQETAGSAAGVHMLDKRKAHFHHGSIATMRDGYYGLAKFKKPMGIKYISGIGVTPFAFQARTGLGIEKMEDLRGKKVICNSPAAPWLTVVATRLLEYYGLSLNDIVVLDNTGTSGVKRTMLERRADAFFWASKGAFRIEIAKSVGLVNLPLSKEAIEHAKKYESVISYTLADPKWLSDIGMSPKAKMGVVGAISGLVCRDDLSDEVVYLVTKAFYDHPGEAAAYGKVVKQATLELALTSIPIPVHPGAIKYYKEKGIWTAEHDKIQKELLAKPRGK